MFNEKKVKSFLNAATGVAVKIDDLKSQYPDETIPVLLERVLSEYFHDDHGRDFIESYLDQDCDDDELRWKYPEFRPATPSARWRVGSAAVRIATSIIPNPVEERHLLEVVDHYEHLNVTDKLILQKVDSMFAHRQLSRMSSNTLRSLAIGLADDVSRMNLHGIVQRARDDHQVRAAQNGTTHKDGFFVQGVELFSRHSRPDCSFTDWFIETFHEGDSIEDNNKLRRIVGEKMIDDLDRYFPRG